MSASSAWQVFSREEARRFFAVTERQLRSWERHGLLPRRESFTLTDLVALKTLAALRDSRIAPAKLKQAIAGVRSRLAHVDDPLTELRIYSENGRIRVDVAGSTMEPVSGQLLLNFDRTELKKLLAFPSAPKLETTAGRTRRRAEAELLFEKGLEMEQTGSPIDDVIATYRHAVETDPSCSGALVNLGTIHFNAKRYQEAETYYRRALETDPDYALAHFNLGNLYDERGLRVEALEHYMAALRISPEYADAHYNVALLYQTTGETMKAVRHWKTYLKLDANSAWAAIARRELDKLKSATIVRGRAEGS